MERKGFVMKHPQRGGAFLGFCIGLVLGVMIAAGVVWYVNKVPSPFVGKAQNTLIRGSGQPLALPGKPGDPVLAPGAPAPPIQPAQPAQSPQPAAAAPASPPAALEKPHYLQAGSFSNPQEADNLKALLAMKGVEADIRQVMVQDKTFYRLIVGPYEKIADADRARAELARDGVETLLLN
jgi:cell division protein FtsN